jgi:hypothetical protein
LRIAVVKSSRHASGVTESASVRSSTNHTSSAEVTQSSCWVIVLPRTASERDTIEPLLSSCT